MYLLAYLIEIGILFTGFIGIGLAFHRLLPSIPFCLTFCLGPWLITSVLFFIEHFIPLGQAHWLWMPACAGTLYLLKDYPVYREPVIWYFTFGFIICFFWRFSFPDILPTSEEMADEVHLLNYSSGGLLPAEDHWLKGERDIFYYNFMYYGSGLIPRWTGCEVGFTYNIAYCVLSGFSLAGIGVGVQLATKSIFSGALAAVAIGLGGVGTTLVTVFMSPDGGGGSLQAMRFIGSYAVADPVLKYQFGNDLIHFIGQSSYDCPVEYFSYIIKLGDFHPSLCALLFFGITILVVGTAERLVFKSLADRVCVAAGLATIPYITISNTWILPLQAAFIICWLVYRQLSGKPDDFRFLSIAAAGSWLLIFPYFREFALAIQTHSVQIRLVTSHVPILDWLIVMFPGVLAWGLNVLDALRARSNFSKFTAVVGLGAMACTYLLYAKDVYSGEYEYFNTALKWWPWVYALTIVMGIIASANSSRLRILMVFLVALTLPGNLFLFGFYDWYRQDKNHAGHLDGYAWFRESSLAKDDIYNYLRTLPQGVLMESTPLDHPAPCITLAQFTGHFSLGGWVPHERLWRGYARNDLDLMDNNRNAFYEETLNDPRGWLAGVMPGGVDYVVWLDRDNSRGDGANRWEKANEQIKSDYDWHAIEQVGDTYTGVWIKHKRP